MKRIFTLLAFSISATAFAGTPTIDGVINPGEGWGTEVGTGDNTPGWSNANAKKLYVTYDANYVYFGAEVTAENWQQFVFAVNTKPGGGTTDSWGRTITYNHGNPPDFLFRGDINQNANANLYTEFHVWDGTQWTGTGTNVNAANTEARSTWTGNDGFIEIRVPRALIGVPMTGDVQFIITGNNSGAANGHGSFDAIPNDNNSSSWNAPGNASVLTQYVSNIVMPLNLVSFSGSTKEGTTLLKWSTTNEVNVSHFEVELSTNGSEWRKMATVSARNLISSSDYSAEIRSNERLQLYRLKMVDKDGRFSYSSILRIRQDGNNRFELMSNPVRNEIRLSISGDQGLVQAEVVSLSGKRVTASNFNHAGGTSTMRIELKGVASGVYILNVVAGGEKQTFRVVVQ